MRKGKIRFVAVAAFAVLALTESASAYYSPAKGRFLARDPIGEKGGANLYGFTQNGTVNGVDCLGDKTYFIHGFNGDNGVIKGLYDHYKGKKWYNVGGWHATTHIALDIVSVRKENPKEPIVIVGHSYGGSAGLIVAGMLKHGFVDTMTTTWATCPQPTVDLLFAIDPQSGPADADDGVVPDNVKYVTNVRQDWPGAFNVHGDDWTLEDPKKTTWELDQKARVWYAPWPDGGKLKVDKKGRISVNRDHTHMDDDYYIWEEVRKQVQKHDGGTFLPWSTNNTTSRPPDWP